MTARPPLLTLGRVDRVRVQVGYRTVPDGPVHEHFLLDLALPEADVSRDDVDEARLLAALEPVLYAGDDAPRHYSLHQHRWHTSWGPSPGAVEIGLLVTTGPRAAAAAEATYDAVSRAFHDVMELIGRPAPAPVTRDAAVWRARHATATAYALDPEALVLTAEEHRGDSWVVGLRTATGDDYRVVVGFLDGFAGAVRVRHQQRVEVFDSVGSE